MLRIPGLIAAALVAIPLACPVAHAAMPTAAPEAPRALSDDELAEVVDFIVGNSVFALYHQAGHMMALRQGWPENDEAGADRFAAVTLLASRSGAGDQTLVDAIDSFRLARHQQADAGSAPVVLPDAHSLDAARAAAIACDMVGDDPAGFSDVADALDLPHADRARCGTDWRRTMADWRAKLSGVLRPAASEGARLPIGYDPPLDADVAEATILQDNRVLEEVAEKLGTTYDLPQPPKVRASHCGEPTSRYDEKRNELVLCYELAAYFGQLILTDIESRG